ncbi:hypothetical protein HN371_05625 [Candidatus Poribacteria bacterium]|jgi:hypothetical protein|nr:hypothetical protein [Candidatus Poribacteria bacterium]MBT5531904.1 hypothetical protein [Candidatus Poribacteria bacterium]MBT5710212.1 hypothetical protein [Candidatus Poribacteria bacterium]MBT7806262.1 hypothetical protein [Candidatus Poribacteria bacterium]
MRLRSAATVLVATAAVSWGCSATTKQPRVARPAPERTTAAQSDASPTVAPGTGTVPQAGLGNASSTAAKLPGRVQRFITAMKGGRNLLSGAWITAQEARQYLPQTVPALVAGLSRREHMKGAQDLLVDIGPRAAPYLRTELTRLQKEAREDPTLGRAVRQVEELLRTWR